jgi:hypothetical protein
MLERLRAQGLIDSEQPPAPTPSPGRRATPIGDRVTPAAGSPVGGPPRPPSAELRARRPPTGRHDNPLLKLRSAEREPETLSPRANARPLGPRRALTPSPAVVSRVSQEAITAPPEDEDAFDRPTLDVIVDPNTGEVRPPHPSELPTAPPPEGFDASRMRTVPRAASVANLSVEEPPEPSLPPQPALSRRAMPSRPGAPAPARVSARDPAQDMRDRFAMGDFSGSLELAERLLAANPGHVEAASMAKRCREVLFDMYASRLGDMTRSPRVVMTTEQIRWLSLDHRAGFLLSLVDGLSSVDDLLDVCGMPRLDAMRLLCSLLDQRVFELH